MSYAARMLVASGGWLLTYCLPVGVSKRKSQGYRSAFKAVFHVQPGTRPWPVLEQIGRRIEPHNSVVWLPPDQAPRSC